MDRTPDIASPALKAASAVASAAGAAIANGLADPGNFLPHDLGGWLAAGASACAIFYSLLVISEWFWKRLWRPLFVWVGWLAPRQYRTDWDTLR